jgi:hypothetical protein
MSNQRNGEEKQQVLHGRKATATSYTEQNTRHTTLQQGITNLYGVEDITEGTTMYVHSR